jgi:hypothetical protein
LCGAAFLGLLWALYQLRLHQIKRRFAVGLGAQVGERLRIARELHDTLLQSFQGVAFQLQAARKLMLRKANNAEEVLDDAILATEEAIREGRSAIRNLRPEPAAQRNLSELLDAAGRELATAHELNGQAPSYRVLVEGKQQDISPMLQDEVYRIHPRGDPERLRTRRCPAALSLPLRRCPQRRDIVCVDRPVSDASASEGDFLMFTYDPQSVEDTRVHPVARDNPLDGS